MDKAQLERLLSVLENAVSQRSTQEQQAVTTSHPLTILPKFDNFDSAQESFIQYIQRFENYMKMKNAFTNEMCAKMLLNSIGASNFSLLSSLAAPKLPSEITYNEIIALLSKHLSPKKNMVVEQHRFLSCLQSEQQSQIM